MKYTRSQLQEIPLIDVLAKSGVYFCNTCKRGFLLPDEQEHIKETGQCYACEHNYAEGLEQKELEARHEALDPFYSQDLPF